jgi:hypothetical protein
MMLTEEEARKNVCPLIKYCINEPDVIGDGRPALYVHQNCQASDCKIGWRWDLIPAPLSAGKVVAAGTAVSLAYALQPRELVRGYCGAFGKPVVTA